MSKEEKEKIGNRIERGLERTQKFMGKAYSKMEEISKKVPEVDYESDTVIPEVKLEAEVPDITFGGLEQMGKKKKKKKKK